MNSSQFTPSLSTVTNKKKNERKREMNTTFQSTWCWKFDNSREETKKMDNDHQQYGGGREGGTHTKTVITEECDDDMRGNYRR